jgi:hypothetical protein
MRAPFKEADTKLKEYAVALRGGDDRAEEGASQISEGKSAVDARQGEVPDLVELMNGEPTRMQRVIDRFQREIRRASGRRDSSDRSRGNRRDRNEARASLGDRPDDKELGEKSAGDKREGGEDSGQGDGENGDSEQRQEAARAQRAAAARARRERVLRQWQAATGDLSFDDLSPCDRVDYLLLQNHIEYQLHRLQRDSANADRGRPQPVDASGISGRPIGREALLRELKHEMVAYEPEELIEIAEKEYAWCQAELRKASQEMGLGDDWRAAIEKVKSMHVAPGEQPYLIHSLAWEAIDYLKKHELVTVPPIAAETWRMQMMSPERQLINPFFTGGTTISVSFPTDSMAHEAKLQSMRGNNIPFARATVHHELIPGHNLQSFMNARYNAHRRPFATPFWGEGWALYWEMLLYERGFPTTPEDRVGFLVWRQHRCARIVFSLSYHLERMTPVECIDFLVDKVGFDRNNATAEVRRSVENAQPLYQAAYMLGGLQFKALRRELVESGKMTNREFHDAILQAGSMPVVMVRALVAEQTLPQAEAPSWRFYEADATE